MTKPLLTSTEKNPYRAPETLPLVDDSTPSPRTRFWIVCLCAFLAAPALIGIVAVHRRSTLLICAALVTGWICAIIWVWSAHLQLPGARNGPLRSLIVAAGLTIAMAISFVLGIAGANRIFAFFR